MDSILGNLPSFNPQNFSQIKPCSDPYISTRMTPSTYVPTHCTLPPPDQVIKTELGNILPRHIYCNVLEQVKPNEVAAGSVLPEHEFKQLQVST
ncbi:DET1- and DDB1-associated protein 1 isoform X2 [Cicer arietinum]|uniref:Uncharacterized protein LOC105851812 isoform X2 n=1 Tax=Cicer arietinum TaxID=3827 RepID=A0A1S3E1E8_CICAR|nr:uncharacterized protein LOC105851812 isoform X2 [Cicer arietinum]XP_012569274.1 uncharacterized protein LOC105851812 isoform X2 [Cicer arietinum]XP_012569275.1 uncharacterized protein LOC105851812 isoform X2 [Cicer arietinum]